MPPSSGDADQLILVVDDEECMRAHYRRVLTRGGYACALARDVAEAEEILRTRGAALILLDLRLPGRDGMEYLRLLARRRQHPPVIMVSGYVGVPEAVEATRLGAATVLTKPVTPRRLLTEIRRVLAPAGDPLMGHLTSDSWAAQSREEVARQFHVSPETVSRCVRRATGRSFRDQRTRRRLEQARRMLTDTDLEATEIARRLGYRHYQSFARVFRQATGMSPRQYRRAHRG